MNPIKTNHKQKPYSFKDWTGYLIQSRPTLKVAIKLDEINQTQVVKTFSTMQKLTMRPTQADFEATVSKRTGRDNNKNNSNKFIEYRGEHFYEFLDKTFITGFYQTLNHWCF